MQMNRTNSVEPSYSQPL